MRGCGDHSCLVQRPVGMGTNGGCRCPPLKLRWRISQLQAALRMFDERIHSLEMIEAVDDDVRSGSRFMPLKKEFTVGDARILREVLDDNK